MVAEASGVPRTETIDELIRERRSIRRFRPDSVPRSLVAELFRTAIWSPSPHNSQPWRFTVLFEGTDKERLARAMAERLREELSADQFDPTAIERQLSRSYGRISTAPVVVLCSLENDGLVAYPDERRNTLEWQMAVQSMGAVLQSVFLAASACSLGSCWMAAPMYCPDVVRDALHLPAVYDPQALVLIGYPAGPGKVRPRRPFEQVVELR
jgi:coenzyme F420-0:L-glutamate ligase/coenzyme F420-1:gamma-L-glutamate ligase